MTDKTSFHSICAWTFNAGKGGFTPANIRPQWNQGKLDTIGKIGIIEDQIAPRIPSHIQLGMEMHFDYEYDEKNAGEIADALAAAGIYLAMTTPGAHAHFGYGGIASLDPDERRKAEEFGEIALALTYGSLRKAWHPDPSLAPTLVLWNGSYGYDLATIGVRRMYQNLKESVARLCESDAQKGGGLFIAIEPKPNEGHPAMLLPTVASALLFWRKLESEFGISRERKGVNKEFGHSEMIGLDIVYDTVEELDDNAMVHMHINSQGYSDGIVLGGPGKFDIDHGVRINGANIAVAGLLREAGYNRWKGHDMQPRAYDDESQAVERIVRSILSWDACETAASEFDVKRLMECLAKRDTISAEDMTRHAVVRAQELFDEMR
jgi:xylose isomerase